MKPLNFWLLFILLIIFAPVALPILFIVFFLKMVAKNKQ
jgi:hypothetical protein